jgi:hypothetical protein
LISRWRRKADTDNNRGDFEADELTDEHHRVDVANVPILKFVHSRVNWKIIQQTGRVAAPILF